MSDLEGQIEALQNLQQHPGWHVFKEAVLHEIAGQFEDDITRALDTVDSTIALDRMRQVAAVRKAGLRWLKLPAEKLAQLKQQAQVEAQAQSPGRRPVGM